MSGFCGFTNFLESNNIIDDMLEKISHRGRAYRTTFSDDFLTMGYTGRDAQLITMDDISIVFDGRCYQGVALYDLYKAHGIKMIEHMQGNFAMAVYDHKLGKLFIARDHFGTKPLYFMHRDNCVIFGSEIKSFLAHPQFEAGVNLSALEQYLSFQYSPTMATFFEGVYKVPPGSYLVFENGKKDMEMHYHYQFAFAPEEGLSFDAAVDTIDRTVSAAMEASAGVDDNIGAFLSGGVDSSYIAALFSKQGTHNKTITVGFEYEKYNEIGYAKTLSDQLGLNHISKIISTQEYWESLPKVQYHMDEPLADPAAVAFYFACKEAANHVTSAFSGEGADEFFGGYNIYKEPLSLQGYTRLPKFLRQIFAKIATALPPGTKGRSFILRGAKTVEARFIGNAFIFTKEERDQILKNPTQPGPMSITAGYYNDVKHLDDTTKMQYLDIRLWLPEDILLQADKMSMAHGLNILTPFMGKDVIKTAARLPLKHRVNKKTTKVAFRAAAHRHLPPEVATRKKLGFPIPIRIWLREEKYYNKVKEAFVSDTSKQYFREESLLNLLDNHYHNKTDNSRKIWAVYMFLLWHKEFFT